jgi:2-dehydropantoate 2-reductase
VKVLLIGAGVVGTVYGAALGAAGHDVQVRAHGSRTDAVGRVGLRARDVLTGVRAEYAARVVEPGDPAEEFDAVLVAVRYENLAAVAEDLAAVSGEPLFLLFGNTPSGRAATPLRLPGPVHHGFPGIGGTMAGDVAEYAQIAAQPTALDAGPDQRLAELAQAFEMRGFAVQRVADMTGWLSYHAVFVACVSQALYRCQADPRQLAGDRAVLRMMCRAITDGFAALRRQGVAGAPRNLTLLHRRALQPVARRYWARTLRSPLGELAFAAHSRHAEREMRDIARDILVEVLRDGEPASLRGLLTQAA